LDSAPFDLSDGSVPEPSLTACSFNPSSHMV
jgi:hypothetical protein